MADPAPDLSVVVALFNEQDAVAELFQRLSSTLEATSASFELVMVDDASEDETAPRLRQLERHDHRVRVIELAHNHGQAAALACGLFEARGKVLVTMDGDLQNPPEEIPRLVRAITAGAAVATGRRAQRHEAPMRRLASRAIHWLARLFTNVNIEDFGGNFKAYRRDIVEPMRRSYILGEPLFPLALRGRPPVQEVTVDHAQRRFGRSRYNWKSNLRLLAAVLRSLFSFRAHPKASQQAPFAVRSWPRR